MMFSPKRKELRRKIHSLRRVANDPTVSESVRVTLRARADVYEREAKELIRQCVERRK